MPTKAMYFDKNPHNPIYNFSEWLKCELELQDMSITKLSQISGITFSTIHGYIKYHHEPSFFNAVCLITALGYKFEVINDNK